MRRLLAGVVALLFLAPCIAFAQGQSVRQSGSSVTPNTIPAWVTNGVISGGVTAADSPVTSFGVTNAGQLGNCVNSARQASAAGYIGLCSGFVSGVPTISVQNYGAASAQPLQFIVNGTTYPFPGALAGITINSTSVTGGTPNDCLTIGASVVTQTACPIITAPTTGSGSVVFNTSPTFVGTVGGNLTWSGNQIYSGNTTFNGQAIFTGTTAPSQTVGNTVISGTLAPPTLASQGQGYFYNTVADGAVVHGDGSVYDVALLNKVGTVLLGLPTGSSTVTLPLGLTLSGLSSGTCTNGLGLNASNQAITVSCPGAASSIQVGTTTISSGASGNIEYNNSGVLGELTPNGGTTLASTNLQVDGNYTGWGLSNCTLAASVNSNLLTVALKNNSGSDPSATSPCNINYRNVTAATGSTTLVQQTSALSIGTNATGATLGSSNNTAFRFWVVVFNNAGTNVMALINCSNSTNIFPLNEGVIASSTGISASATSAGVFYTPNGTTVTSKAYRILGYIEYNATGLVTAGTYASAPNFVQAFGPGIRKPGEPVQFSDPGAIATSTTVGASATQTTTLVAITPTSAANQIKVNSSVQATINVNTACTVQLSRGATPTLIGNIQSAGSGAVNLGGVGFSLFVTDFPNTTSSTTYYVYGSTGGGSTCTIGGSGSKGTIQAVEIMG